MRRPSRRHARILLAVVIATLLASAALDVAAASILDIHAEDVAATIRRQGAAAPLALIGLMIIAVVVPPLPSVPLDIAAGAVFGIVWGVTWVLIGAEIAAIIAFLIARRLGRSRLEHRLDPHLLARVDAAVEQHGMLALLVLRLVPTFHFDLVSYAAGLTAMSLSRFAIATLVGMTPPVIAIVAVGDQLDAHPSVAIAIFGALVVLALGPLVWWSLVRERR